MDGNLEKAKKILKQYGQDHLLEFYEELNENEKFNIVEDILCLDFKKIITLYNNSMKKEQENFELSPLPYQIKERLTREEDEKFYEIGEEVIKNKQFAVVTMAGGQGTRLGYKGPKGTYQIKFSNKETKSLFEIMAEDIKEVNEKYNIVIPWYIMVSKENKEKTIKFFKQKNYFGYDSNYIKFFVQDVIPLIDINGKIVLQECYKVKMVSNGNGDVFKSMKCNGIIDELKAKDIKWVSFAGIDNILLKNVDIQFLGMLINSKMKIGSKSIFKEEPLEKTAIYCKKNGRPSILYYDEITMDISEKKDEAGNYLYRDANMLYHVMSIDAIEKIADVELPYHRAYKKNPIVNEEGMKIVPESPNTFKFENFIFDAFKYFDDMFLLRVSKEKEFAPIKDFTGLYTPETAKEKYEKEKKIQILETY